MQYIACHRWDNYDGALQESLCGRVRTPEALISLKLCGVPTLRRSSARATKPFLKRSMIATAWREGNQPSSLDNNPRLSCSVHKFPAFALRHSWGKIGGVDRVQKRALNISAHFGT